MASVIKLHKIIEFFGDPKIIAKGENHIESGNVHTCNFVLGVLSGNVHSSMKNKLNNVEVNLDFYCFKFDLDVHRRTFSLQLRGVTII